jgi:hypothetical protein
VSAHESDPRWRYADEVLRADLGLPPIPTASVCAAAAYEKARIELEHQGITNPLEHLVAEAKRAAAEVARFMAEVAA